MKRIILFISLFTCGVAISQPRYNNRHDFYRRDVGYRIGPRSGLLIPFGNYYYHYSDGYFYRSFGASLRIVIPPVGIFINILPRGYRTVHYPGGYCYYYHGIYYQENNNRYQVIDAPGGAVVPGLLADAKTVVINNEKLYELNGIYYKEEVNSNGDINYKVVGKKGETPTEESANGLQAGDTIEHLPEGSKAIVINGQKLYVSPANEYFEEIIQGDSIAYKMVGNEVK